MSSLETTELKLKTTPTGGAEAHVSPYYRRLVSAGYKGFLQGTIGGAALYGTFGLIIGGLLAAAAAPIASVTTAIWLLAPACAGIGVLKGASTFGQIGSVAAINAESSDLSEQRRYLLDRYYDLPDGPEGDKEAEAIKHELLRRAADQGAPPHIFHWKTIAIGAVVGAGLALAFLSPLGLGLMASSELVSSLALKFGVSALISQGVLTAGGMALGALGGGLAGASIGIDRYYIRKWFDHTQDIIHSGSHVEGALLERHQQVQRLKEAAKEDQKTKQHLDTGLLAAQANPMAIATTEIKPAPMPSTASQTAATLTETAIKKASESSRAAVTPDKPTHTISAARRMGLLEIQKAMELPTV